jgi:antitoxin FitA
MEAEARSILQSTLKEPERRPARNLYERIRARFEPLGGADLELPPRLPDRDPPRFAFTTPSSGGWIMFGKHPS